VAYRATMGVLAGDSHEVCFRCALVKKKASEPLAHRAILSTTAE
jgi:hypothetical protein